MAPVRCWIIAQQEKPIEDEISAKSSVRELKNQIATKNTTCCSADNLDMIFCGHKLDDDDLILEKCPGFDDKTVVYVVGKTAVSTNRSVIPPADEAEGLITSLQTTVLDPQHRAMLTRIISNADTMQNLIECVPGLRHDTVAQGILKDPYLLAHWVTDERAVEHFSKHPCLYDACQYIMNSLHAEVVRQSGTAAGAGLDTPMLPPPPPPGVHVGDPFASDDDEEDDDEQQNAGHHQQQITPQQLAAALAMAAGVVPPQQQQRSGIVSSGDGGNISSSSAAASSPAAITSDMLQMAMRQALATNTTAAAGSSGQQQAAVMREQLEQLRDMGFSNPEENARALRASNGDVMAAVEYIIAQRERQEQGFGLD